jgi:protein-S-isoprenylcysteine O-methyltransferase Ste14
MSKKLIFGYGLISYLIFLGVFLYTIGFVGNLVVPKSIDWGTTGPLWQAILVDVLLLGLFALQHSGMARPAFKRWWTRIIPKPMERSTYVLLASLTLALIFWQWRPLPAVIWTVELQWARWLLWGLYGLGWLMVLVSAQLISSGHLFGLQQVREHLRGHKPSSPKFQAPAFYRYVRHPLMLGFLIAFWATPQMTVGHLLFSIGMTGYILIGLQFEERDLIRRFGKRYQQYKARVPMLIPRLTGQTSQPRPVEPEQSSP